MPPTTRLMVRTKTKSISHCLLLKAVRRDRLLLLGDFNVRVGSERVGYEDMVGPHSGGERSENGARLLAFAKGLTLRIAGMWFQRSNKHCWTWYSNKGTFAAESLTRPPTVGVGAPNEIKI